MQCLEMPFNDLVEKLDRAGIQYESPTLSSFVGDATLIQAEKLEFIKVISVTQRQYTSNGGIVTTATGRQYGTSHPLMMVWRDWEITYIPKGKKKPRFSELDCLGSFIILAEGWQEIDQEEPLYGVRSPQRFAAMLQNVQKILYARF